MRCHTKLDFAETYCFGHNLCNSGPFLLKMGLKCAHFKGYYMRNRLKPVEIGLVALFEKHATATASLVQFGFQSFSGCMDRTCRPKLEKHWRDLRGFPEISYWLMKL